MMNQTMTILTGNGDGTFTVGTPVSTGMPAGSGAYQRQVVAGDFNGDGHTDVAVVIEWRADGDPSLSVLFGNGDGTFGLPSTFTAAPADAFYDEAVAVGDFFGTGKILDCPAYRRITLLRDDSAGYVAGFTPVKKMPTITWAAPAAITNPTPLSATQLNATASVPGTFVYTPAAGTVLAAGWQTLSVTFIPTDTVDYSPAEAMVTLTVNPAPPVTYTLTTSTKSVEGSASVMLRLVSTNYAGTVSFHDQRHLDRWHCFECICKRTLGHTDRRRSWSLRADNHRQCKCRKPHSCGSVDERRCGSVWRGSSRRTVHRSPKAGSGCPAEWQGQYPLAGLSMACSGGPAKSRRGPIPSP